MEQASLAPPAKPTFSRVFWWILVIALIVGLILIFPVLGRVPLYSAAAILYFSAIYLMGLVYVVSSIYPAFLSLLLIIIIGYLLYRRVKTGLYIDAASLGFRHVFWLLLILYLAVLPYLTRLFQYQRSDATTEAF